MAEPVAKTLELFERDVPKPLDVHRVETDSLLLARAEVFAKLDAGSECPCCGQLAKAYARSLHSGMAAFLIWLCREHTQAGDWIDVPKRAPRWVLQRVRDFSILRMWDLIEKRPAKSGETNRGSGWWRPTLRGYAFAEGKAKVPQKVVTFNGQARRFEGEDVDIRAALGTKFDFDALWSGEED